MDWQHTLDIKPSRIAQRLPWLVLLLCLLALALCAVSLLLKVSFALLLLALHWQQQGALQTVVVSRIGYAQQHWWAIIRDKHCVVELAGEQLVLHGLLVLHLREVESGRVSHVVLWPDSASHDALRRLRVILRHL